MGWCNSEASIATPMARRLGSTGRCLAPWLRAGGAIGSLAQSRWIRAGGGCRTARGGAARSTPAPAAATTVVIVILVGKIRSSSIAVGVEGALTG